MVCIVLFQLCCYLHSIYTADLYDHEVMNAAAGERGFERC